MIEEHNESERQACTAVRLPGILPFERIGRHVYIKKGDIMEAIENQMTEMHRKWGHDR